MITAERARLCYCTDRPDRLHVTRRLVLSLWVVSVLTVCSCLVWLISKMQFELDLELTVILR
jgi:hypothetical protein